MFRNLFPCSKPKWPTTSAYAFTLDYRNSANKKRAQLQAAFHQLRPPD